MTKTDTQAHYFTPSIIGRGNWRYLLLVLLLTLLILGLTLSYAHSRFGSFAATMSVLRGDALLVNQPLKSMDGIRPGSDVSLVYILTNASDRPIKIISMTSSCSCTVMSDLPMTIETSERKSVTAIVTTRKGEPLLDGSIRLYTDHPNSPEIRLGYVLRLTPPPPH